MRRSVLKPMPLVLLALALAAAVPAVAASTSWEIGVAMREPGLAPFG